MAGLDLTYVKPQQWEKGTDTGSSSLHPPSFSDRGLGQASSLFSAIKGQDCKNGYEASLPPAGRRGTPPGLLHGHLPGCCMGPLPRYPWQRASQSLRSSDHHSETCNSLQGCWAGGQEGGGPRQGYDSGLPEVQGGRGNTFLDPQINSIPLNKYL